MAIAADNSPPVRLHDVAPSRVTIQCHDPCATMTRVYRIEPATQIGAFRYCPVCGSRNISAYMSAETNHWEAMARDFQLPIPVLQQLYRLWEPHSYYRFADYVAVMRPNLHTLATIEADRKKAARAAKERAYREANPITVPLPKLVIPPPKKAAATS